MRFRSKSWTADGEIRHNVQDSTEQHEPLMDPTEQHEPLMESDTRKPRTGPRAVILSQGKTFFLLVLAWILFVVYIRTGLDPSSSTLPSPKATQLGPANFHLIVPASKADPNLCKVLVSAAVTGYPSPTIINWNQTFDEGQFVEGGSHLAKISGVHGYLANLDPYQGEDLVLMVDGYDVWMQLKPQTLIDRYFDINKRADERISKQLGQVAKTHNIHQEIIFGCQKKCWPWTENDPPCYAVPQSSLPKDIYGPQTDTDVGNEANPYIKYRPRFINSGVAIGTVRALRKMFERAIVLLETEKNMGSDQYIFSHILGDQEVWREALRQDFLSSGNRRTEQLDEGVKQQLSPKPNSPQIPFKPEHIAEVRAKAAARPDKSMEFNIGLDYGSEIGLNTVFAEDDTAWLTWNDAASLRAAETKLSIPPSDSRMTDLPPDIVSTVPPFWTFSHEPALHRWTTWSQIPLFTNVWTGIVPAIIHHNAHRDGRKALRKTWWDRIWFFGYARTMYDVSVYAPVLPVAYSGGREYWPFERWKGGGRNGASSWDHHFPGTNVSEKWVPFADMCNEWHEEVFRDGLGEWVLPNVH